MATTHPQDGSEPSSSAGGRPPAFKPEHIAVLHDIVIERAPARLQEIADELHHRCALRVCAATIRRALRVLGVVRRKQLRGTDAVRAEGVKRYGYTAAHRREAICPYSTNQTDAEWELVADLFEGIPGQRGTPVHYNRRDLVNACLLLRAAHRLCLAAVTRKSFPPSRQSTRRFRAGWTPVYSNRCKSGCANNGGYVWDAQVRQARWSFMHSPPESRRKVAQADLMQARRSRAASVISSSIRWGWSSQCRCRSPPRACKTGMRRQPW